MSGDIDQPADRSEAVAEARRVMTICNACRYCEGLCATFQSMTLRRTFLQGDLEYLANLCHNCTACFHGCQYAPPHEFDVNVPRALTALRVETYEQYAWPPALAGLFQRNGLVVSLAIAASLILVMTLAFVFVNADAMFGEHSGPGAFYEVIGHGIMVAVAGATFGFSVLAMVMGTVRFQSATRNEVVAVARRGSLFAALKSAATMKYLGGGHGEGCSTQDDGTSNQRRYFHQLTMWGFLLCFAATCVATVYDYGLGLIAPYPFFSAPVLLGTIGGVGLLVGPVGLVWVKLNSDRRPMLLRHYGMDYAFLALLFLASLSGLLLLGVRETAAMGVTLAVHLGFVLAFFVTLPYGKFVHAIYRLSALIRFSGERE